MLYLDSFRQNLTKDQNKQRRFSVSNLTKFLLVIFCIGAVNFLLLANEKAEPNFIRGLACAKNEDYAEAAKWFRKAAEQGIAVAQYNLAVCYYNGFGVEKDYTETVKWSRKAAEQGNDLAQGLLGECYETGRGMKREDLAEAVKWFKKAAEQGNVKAHVSLGACYLKKAIKCLKKAAEQGDEEAKTMLRSLGVQ